MKVKSKVKIILLVIFIFFANYSACFATEFTNASTTNSNYNRGTAASYWDQYTYTPNSQYYDYSNVGGDCTNFVSQGLKAGGMPTRGTVGYADYKNWYYNGKDVPFRSKSWTDADWFRKYWANNYEGIGYQKAYRYKRMSVRQAYNNFDTVFSIVTIGDVVQFTVMGNKSYHSVGIIALVYSGNTKTDIKYAQHTEGKQGNLKTALKNLINEGHGDDVGICLIRMKK